MTDIYDHLLPPEVIVGAMLSPSASTTTSCFADDFSWLFTKLGGNIHPSDLCGRRDDRLAAS